MDLRIGLDLVQPKTPANKAKHRKNGKKQKRRRWNYNYPPVFFLGLLNFDMRHLTPGLADPDQYIHLFSLRDEKTGELMTDRLRFAFLEVDRFNKPKEACGTFEDRFLFLMKNLPTFVETPELWDDDYQNTLDFAEMKGDSRGYERGKAEGIAEGLAATARWMLAKDRPIEEIVEFTGLTKEQIRAL